MKTLQNLVDGEVTFTIEHYCLGVVTARLGDEMNGFSGCKQFLSVADAVEWLCEESDKKDQ